MYYYGPYHPIYSLYPSIQYSYFPVQNRGFNQINIPVHQNPIQIEDNVKIQPKEETELKPESLSLTFKTTKRSNKPRKLPKDKNFSIRNQDKKRNLISKTIKYFLKYAKCQAIQLHKIDEAIARYRQKCSDYSTEKFIEEIEVRFPEGKHYYSLKSISNCFIDRENSFGIVFRVLFRSFMKWENVFKILYMGKLKRKSKIDYLEKSREIYNSLISTIGRCR